MFRSDGFALPLEEMLLCLFLVVCSIILSASRIAAAAGEIRFDFESGDLQGWEVVEGHLERAVCDREVFHNFPSVQYNKQGKYFLSTLEGAGGESNDKMTGVIESPVFVLTGPEVSFLVGGGGHRDTYVALCTLDDQEVLQARGRYTETMHRVEWNVPELVGQKVFLSIVDMNTGPWGHITFDDFAAAGTIDPEETERMRKSLPERQKKRAEREKALKIEQTARRAQRMEEMMADNSLFERGEPRLYRGENLGAIGFTVGGIGTGSFQMDGKARRSVWQIFNNHRPAFLPDSFFAVRARSAGGRPVIRALQTEAAGPFEGMKALTFRGEYPFAWYTFEDPALPVQVSMEVFSPFIPMDVQNSGIPCAIFNLTAENTGDKPAEVGFLATQQNAVGYNGNEAIEGRSFAGYGGNTNRIVKEKGAVLLHMTRKDAPDSGDMALAALNRGARGVTSWDSPDRLAAGFAKEGAVGESQPAGPSPAGQTLNGALAVPFKLKPGEKRTVTFLLTWYFPKATHGGQIQGWTGSGYMYTNWWPDALGVARDVRARLGGLTRQTRLYHDSLYASNLPYWLLDRLSSQLAILRSQTCFWAKDGYFGAWEGCSPASGCCAGNCSHVWHYAQAHARLFPQIGRIMREQELRFQSPEGAIPHRQPDQFPAFDGQCGGILEAYREHLTGPDRKWLDAHWPKVKKAMEFTITTWDKDEDGVLTGAQWNTLDAALGGSSSWLGSLYLAALAASEKMAGIEGEKEAAARYRHIRKSGAMKQNETLFNGEYYFQVSDEAPQKDYLTGCHIDQVLGQWWANQLDLGRIYPPDRVRTGLGSLFKNNFRADFRGVPQSPRKFVSDEDAGMQMISWPGGGRPDPEQTMLYADEVMSGFEYAAAATMVYSGLMKEGFVVAKAISGRYDGRLRTDVSEGDYASWGYTGNPFGDDECGKFYARAMSVWSLLLASQGFLYDGPKGVIGFKPIWKPEDHRTFFTAAEGWGIFTQTRSDSKQTERIEIRYGKLRLKEMIFELPAGQNSSKVTVQIGDQERQATFTVEGRTIRVRLNRPITLNAGSAINVEVL